MTLFPKILAKQRKMTDKKILITDYVHDLLIEKLKSHGYDFDYMPDITLPGVKSVIKRYCAVVINTKTRMDKEMLKLADSLKLIVRLGSGLDIVDLDYAAEKGIVVERTPEANSNAVAEHAMAMLLALMTNLVTANREVRKMQWNREKNRGVELQGKTVGIIGFGHTGSAFAEKLRSFGVKILVYDKYKQRFAADIRYIQESNMKMIFEHSDILSLHIPLTGETEKMVNRRFLNKFNKNIIFINTSRGKIVKTEDLLDALNSGKVKGAALDVLENEKIDSYTQEEKEMYGELFSKPNVIVTPHIAGWTAESKKKIASSAFEKIEKHCFRSYGER